MCIVITVTKIDLKQKRERVRRSMLDHDADSSPPAPTWCGNLKVAAKILEACISIHLHPIQRSSPAEADPTHNSSIGSLQFHKFFSNPLRCFGGTVVATPLPLSLHLVLRKATPLRASSLRFFGAWRYASNVASCEMYPFTVKRSCSTLSESSP
jgi:hypothetical protein